jgi:hypothetical protein
MLQFVNFCCFFHPFFADANFFHHVNLTHCELGEAEFAFEGRVCTGKIVAASVGIILQQGYEL